MKEREPKPVRKTADAESQELPVRGRHGKENRRTAQVNDRNAWADLGTEVSSSSHAHQVDGKRPGRREATEQHLPHQVGWQCAPPPEQSSSQREGMHTTQKGDRIKASGLGNMTRMPQQLPKDVPPLVLAIQAHGSALRKINTKLKRANANYLKAEARMRLLLDDVFSSEAGFEDRLEDLEDADMDRSEREDIYDPFFDARDRVVEMRQRLDERRKQFWTDRGTLELALIEKVAGLTPFNDDESSVGSSSEVDDLESSAAKIQQEVDFSMRRTDLAAVERWVYSLDAASPPPGDSTPPRDQLSEISSVQIGDEPDSDRNLRTSIQSKPGIGQPQHVGSADRAEEAVQRPVVRDHASVSDSTEVEGSEQPQQQGKTSSASNSPGRSPMLKRKRADADSENDEEQQHRKKRCDAWKGP